MPPAPSGKRSTSAATQPKIRPLVGVLNAALIVAATAGAVIWAYSSSERSQQCEGSGQLDAWIESRAPTPVTRTSLRGLARQGTLSVVFGDAGGTRVDAVTLTPVPRTLSVDTTRPPEPDANVAQLQLSADVPGSLRTTDAGRATVLATPANGVTGYVNVAAGSTLEGCVQVERSDVFEAGRYEGNLVIADRSRRLVQVPLVVSLRETRGSAALAIVLGALVGLLAKLLFEAASVRKTKVSAWRYAASYATSATGSWDVIAGALAAAALGYLLYWRNPIWGASSNDWAFLAAAALGAQLGASGIKDIVKRAGQGRTVIGG